MIKRATMLCMLLASFLLVRQAAAQDPVDVKISEINAVAQAQIDALNAAGASLTAGEINSDFCAGLIYDNNALCNTKVRVTGVVMSDPLNSGLANLNNEGIPSRIHVFIRDVATDTDGPEGMGIQVVDGSNIGAQNWVKGDVVTVVGTVAPFFTTMQLNPESFQIVGSRDLSDPIFNPIVVSTSDINKSVGPDGAVQVNWSNFSAYRGNFVRIEDATVVTRVLAPGGRVDFSFTSDVGVTSIALYDTSIRFRNDRSDYPSSFNTHSDDYEPPPPGSRINIQGFLTYPGIAGSDPFGLGVPFGALLAINPFDDSDVEVTQSPPAIGVPSRPDFVPGTVPITISADVVPDPTRTLTTVELSYFTSSDPTVMNVSGTPTTGDTYEFVIPAASDGDFVSYKVVATDSQGATSESDEQNYRVLANGITNISDIQLTVDEGSGSSPFKGVSDFMNIQATVMSTPATSGFYVVQDDPGLAPWTGIALEGTSAVQALGLLPGDVVNITGGTVTELRGPDRFDRSGSVTGIGTPTVSVTSTGGAPFDYKEVTTDVLQDAGIAEGFESMMLRFTNVTIITNQADGSQDFGEFVVGSAGDAVGVRVDDQSDSFSSSFNDDLIPGSVMAFIQGVWSNTFGNNKLMPESLDDIGTITATEDETVPDAFTLFQNYPNPFNPSTTIRFDLEKSGRVDLSVYDMLGRRVRTLLSGSQPAGTHAVTFDARDLASGVYLYRISSGSSTKIRKMLLLK